MKGNLPTQNLSGTLRHFTKLSLILLSVFMTVMVACRTSVAQNNQQQSVQGRVTDAGTGDPMPGVNVVIKGTARGAATNADGEYKLTLESLQDTLIFSFIGYLTREIPISGRATLDVALQPEAITGGELVVTGYTVQRRSDITSAISSVDVESASRQTTASILQRLDGRVSGVTVESSGSPGSRNTVRIRGVSSFQNNDPLYIIDGTPIQDSFINWLNPNDIESMQVLKDASAASIYGSRANNGVVIIETKKGREGPPQVSLNIRGGIATPVRGYDDFLITDALQYHEVVRRSHVNAGVPVPTNIYGDPDNPAIPAYIWPNDGTNQTTSVDEGTYSFPNTLIIPGSAGTNWWDEVFGTAVVSDFNVGVSGGGDSNRYNVSFNYLDQEGTAIYNRFQRGAVRVNTEFDIGQITVGENIAVSRDEHYGGLPNDPDDFVEDGILGKNILMQPVVPVYDIAGNFASGKAVGLGNQTNPVKEAWANKDDVTQNTRMFGNVFARFDLMDRLLLNTSFGFNVGESSFLGFTPMFPENSEPTFVQSIEETNDKFTDWTWSNTLTYIDTFAELHNVNVLVGHEANEITNRRIEGTMSGLITTDINARFLQDAIGDPETKNVVSEGFTGALLSFFGKIDYNYAEKYHLSLTIRRDGSSRLGSDHRWGTFPAVSVGWRLTNEPFLADNEIFTNIMLRAGWGLTGNQGIPAGRTVDQYGGETGDTFYDIGGSDNSIIPGFRQISLGNPDLKWEENESVNVGADFEFLEGRANFVVDVYMRETDNLLFDPVLPATAGIADAPIINIGKMRNTGVDFSIGYRGTAGNEILWSVNFNGAHYTNEIVRIDGQQEFFFGPITTRFGNQVINQVGEPIGAFYGFVQDGIFQNEAEVDAHATQPGAAPGRFRFRDVNGDGVINAGDRTIIGDPHPDFTGGLDLGVQWRNWDFNATLFGTFGNDIFDVQKEFYVFQNFSTNVRDDLLTDSWTPDNPDAKYPRLDINDTFSRDISSFYVEDGSYVRLRNLQIGYTLPPTWIPQIRNLRIFVQGENLFTITGYDGLDPVLPAADISGGAGDQRDQYRGIDRGSYPSSRTISLGVSATF